MKNIHFLDSAISCSIRKPSEKKELNRFWNAFFDEIANQWQIDNKDSTKSDMYKLLVIEKLMQGKEGKQLCSDDLRKLQLEIEDLSMAFDEQSIFKTVPNLIRTLIRIDEINAKDYLRGKVELKEDKELLAEFGQYTIEALIIHVLSMVFNSLEESSIIRLASLIEQLESCVRSQAALLKHRRCKKDNKNSIAVDDVNHSVKEMEKNKYDTKYAIGSRLVDFMVDRGLISLTNEMKESIPVRTKNNSYYLPKHVCVYCNFDLSLLPIKLNLPMVYPPLDWKSACPKGKNPTYLSDLSGGYLSGPGGDIYHRYRLLSSDDINHFYIDIGENYEKLCKVMNKLQGQPFEINSVWLNYIQENEHSFVKNGLLMPRFLASMNIKDVSNILREHYMKDDVIKQFCSYSDLIQTLCKNIQRSRYEQLIIKLAKAYEGYQFYLPAFLDFRGRIYRSGILHFHERDLARSMILLGGMTSNNNALGDHDLIIKSKIIMMATSFHYKSFNSFNDSYNWFFGNELQHDERIVFARDAKRPFQYLSNLIGLSKGMLNKANMYMKMPITQDASASAYQIMSYFMLDKKMAMRTNLIPSGEDKIEDVYIMILEELKEFIQKEWGNVNKHLSLLVRDNLTRKIVKGIFMPIIYGKTIMSTASDLKAHFSRYLTHKECFDVASLCFKFWKTKYQGMDCLIRLIRNIGWIASARGGPVIYKVPYLKTVQDYMKMEEIHIWVYDKHHKKRHRITLRVSSSKRNRRKTEISTFVNFIHQRDASIAMNVVESLLDLNAPIYTVHDNFITSSEYSRFIPQIYSKTISNMGHPLSIINEFIYMNVIKPVDKMCNHIPTNDDNGNGVIPKENLQYYLKKNIPDGKMSKKMRATWDERISGTVSSYENYIHNVCGSVNYSDPVKCWEAHDAKWKDFNLFLTRMCEHHTNYIVHY